MVPRSFDGAHKLHFISSRENRNVASGSLWSDSRINELDFGQHLPPLLPPYCYLSVCLEIGDLIRQVEELVLSHPDHLWKSTWEKVWWKGMNWAPISQAKTTSKGQKETTWYNNKNLALIETGQKAKGTGRRLLNILNCFWIKHSINWG